MRIKGLIEEVSANVNAHGARGVDGILEERPKKREQQKYNDSV